MTQTIVLAGVDLAWKSEKNPSAIAIGTLSSSELLVDSVLPAIYGINPVLSALQEVVGLSGVAIDAPLIIKNEAGQRNCEKELGRAYGSRKAAAHTSNATLYPGAKSVEISNHLSHMGFSHLERERWQIECYPHPALIEIFNLDERLKYKKGRVSEKKYGQLQLSRLIRQLATSPILVLNISVSIAKHLNESYIASLAGQNLKSNEDVLDAIICLYIAALYSIGGMGSYFGSIQDGYIWVPQRVCI